MISFCANYLLLLSLFAFEPGPDIILKNRAHPFYISFTEVNYNATEKSLEVSCKLFADDFEQTLEAANKAKLDIASAKDKPQFDRFIPGYFSKHLSLTADGKPVSLRYVGFEKEAESVYCYFEITGVSSVKRMDFANTLLYDFSKEQINILHATVNGKRKSGKVGYPEGKVSFQF
jgi:hypothetical protein